MSHEMSCIVVPRDFQAEEGKRTLFKFVDATFEPEDKNGFEITTAVEAIKKNIQYLHSHILGEDLAIDDPEIERTYQLFLETYREGQKGMQDEMLKDKYSEWLPGACHVNNDYWTRAELPEEKRLQQDKNYVIRSWMAVVTYLLSDYKFLYE
jgi:hypothetical protein